MSEEKETYMGKKLHVKTGAETVSVTINDQSVDVSYDTDTGRYSSLLLPYAGYDSALQLARDIVKNVPEFQE